MREVEDYPVKSPFGGLGFLGLEKGAHFSGINVEQELGGGVGFDGGEVGCGVRVFGEEGIARGLVNGGG